MSTFLNSVFATAGSVSTVTKLAASLWTQMVAAFIILSALGFGWRLRRLVSRTDNDLSLAWSLGIAFFGYTSALIAHAGLLYHWVILIFGFTGLTMLWFDRKTLPHLKSEAAWTKGTKVVMALVALFVVTRFAESTIPNGQGDPLYYHVAAPYYWAKVHGFTFMEWSPWMFQGGLLEYIYSVAATLSGPPMATLISCQIVHAFCGVVLAPLLCKKIAALVLRNNLLAWVAVLAFITVPGDPLVLVRAKNDGLVLLMTLAAVLIFVRRLVEPGSDKLWFMRYALFAAFAIAGKHSAVFLLAPLSVIALVLAAKEDHPARYIFSGAAVVVIAGLWPMARNYLYTGNPIFPAMDDVFRSPLINDAIRYEFTSMTKGNAPFLAALWAQFKAMYLLKPLYVFSVAAIFLTTNRPAQILSIVALAALPLMALLMGDSVSSPRLTLALWCPISVTAVAFLQHLMHLLPKQRAEVAAAVVATVLGLINGKYEIAPVRLVKDVLPYHVSTESSWSWLARQKVEMPVIAWINANVSSGHVFSDNICESLFLDIKMSQAWNNLTANNVFSAGSLEEFHEAFRAAGYTLYLHDKRNRPDRSPAFINDIGQKFRAVFETDALVLYQPL